LFMPNPIELPNYAEPIAKALKNLEFWLSRPDLSSLMIGYSDIEEAKSQTLTSRVEIFAKPRIGKRTAVRKRHTHDQPQLIKALWPQDNLVESSQFTLACVIAGSADFSIEDYFVRCQTGDMVLFLPNIPKQDGAQVHFEGDPTGRACEVLWLSPLIRQDFGMRGWICRCEGDTHFRSMDMGNCSVENKLLVELFTGFCREAFTRRNRRIVYQLLSCMISLFRDEIETGNSMQAWGRPRPETSNTAKDPISEAMAYVQEHIDRHLTIGHVAAHVLVSPSTLTRHLKKRTDKTFQQYLTEVRLKRAVELLQDTNYTIKNIAEHVGLKHGQFWVLFKAYYGCSPSDFRNRQELNGK
jgi:AraC-like DNA-binding protein